MLDLFKNNCLLKNSKFNKTKLALAEYIWLKYSFFLYFILTNLIRLLVHLNIIKIYDITQGFIY